MGEYKWDCQEFRVSWALRVAAREDPKTPADVYENGVTIMIPKWQGWARAARQRLYEFDDQTNRMA